MAHLVWLNKSAAPSSSIPRVQTEKSRSVLGPTSSAAHKHHLSLQMATCADKEGERETGDSSEGVPFSEGGIPTHGRHGYTLPFTQREVKHIIIDYMLIVLTS